MQAEQFNLFEIPATEPKRVRTKWQELQAMGSVWEEQGGLVAPMVAAVLLDVTKQRVAQLMEEGRFKRFEFFGKAYISIKEIHGFVNSPRASGVHVGVPSGVPPTTLKETYKRVVRLQKER